MKFWDCAVGTTGSKNKPQAIPHTYYPNHNSCKVIVMAAGLKQKEKAETGRDL